MNLNITFSGVLYGIGWRFIATFWDSLPVQARVLNIRLVYCAETSVTTCTLRDLQHTAWLCIITLDAV
jgi:hypothetical protein